MALDIKGKMNKDKLTYSHSLYYLELVSGFKRTLDLTKTVLIVFAVLAGCFFFPIVYGLCKEAPLYLENIKGYFEVIRLMRGIN